VLTDPCRLFDRQAGAKVGGKDHPKRQAMTRSAKGQQFTRVDTPGFAGPTCVGRRMLE